MSNRTDRAQNELLSSLRAIPLAVASIGLDRKFVFATRRFFAGVQAMDERSLDAIDEDSCDDAIEYLERGLGVDLSGAFARSCNGIPTNTRVGKRPARDAPTPDSILELRPVFGTDDRIDTVVATLVEAPRSDADDLFRRLQSPFDGIPVGVWEHDQNNVASRVNREWFQMFGYTPEDQGDMSTADFWTSLIHPEDLDRLLVLKQRKAAEVVEYRMRQASGDYRWIRSIGRTNERNADGSSKLALGVMIDIETERRSRQELEIALDRSYKMLDATEDGLIFTSINGMVTAVNAEAVRLLGQPSTEVVGSYVHEVLELSADGEMPIDLYATPLEIGERLVPEADLTTNDGDRIPVSLGHSLAYSTLGVLHGGVIKIRDRRPQLDYYAERDRNERLRALGQLAAGIAHDFNNLLGTMSLAASLLQRSVPNGTAQAHIDMIVTACDSASTLTSKLLTFNPEQRRAMTKFDVATAIENVARILGFTTDKRSRVRLDITSDRPKLLGSSESIETALLNLGINGLQAMPSGGELLISLRSQKITALDRNSGSLDLPIGDYCVIAVSDSGVGMTPEQQERVFEPFYSTREDGTGLGLAMVYGTVVEHGGAIRIDSKPGEGSTFTMYLPISTNFAVEIKRSTVGGTAMSPPVSFAGRSVLIADDNEQLLEMLSIVVEALGCKVYTATDGHAAVRLFKDYHDAIDLTLIDLGMPGLDGRAVMSEVREVQPDASVIVMSGYVPPRDQAALLDAGAVAVVPKPFRLAEIEEAVVQALLKA